jgi:hypothetical protein
MSEGPPTHTRLARAPFHLWVVGLLLVLWNGWGVAMAIATQTNRLPFLDPVTTAHFSAQPLWLVLFGDLGPLAGVAGGVALLLQSRWALTLFIAQFAILALANAYEVALGRSILLMVPETRMWTAILLAMMAFQIGYARLLKRRGTLN